MLVSTKLKLASLVPAAAILAACVANPVQTHQNQPMQESYTCSDNSQIYANYIPEANQVELTATVPKVNWVNQPVRMNLVESASGARFINDASPNVSYQWHTNSSEAILDMAWATGEQYQVNCNRAQ